MSSVEPNEAYMDKGELILKEKITRDKRPLVFAGRSGRLLRRNGRGYSIREITDAYKNIGLKNQNISTARASRIRVDKFRKSAHSENVSNLTAILNTHLKSRKSNDKSKKRSLAT